MGLVIYGLLYFKKCHKHNLKILSAFKVTPHYFLSKEF